MSVHIECTVGLVMQTAAIDIGATWIRGGIVSKDGVITHRQRRPTPRMGRSGAAVTDVVIGILDALLPYASPGTGIGIASAGPLDLKTGSIVSSPNMAFDRIDIVSPCEEHYARPVHLINDCRAGALAEQAYGEGVHSTTSPADLVYITVSSGIGAGVITGGHLLTGSTGNGGEVGHLFVDSRYNLICGCGGAGHFEAYASGTGIPGFYTSFLSRHGYDHPPALTAEEILTSGEYEAMLFKEELGVICGRGLSGIIASYDPEVIVLDGPVARNHPGFVAAMVKNVDIYLPMPRVVVSSLSGDAPLIGAAVWTWRRSMNPC